MYTLFAITGLKKIVPIPLLLEIPHYTGILVVLMKILVFRGIPDNRGNWIYLVKFQREDFCYLVKQIHHYFVIKKLLFESSYGYAVNKR